VQMLEVCHCGVQRDAEQRARHHCLRDERVYRSNHWRLSHCG
jgi:hypothetical protein